MPHWKTGAITRWNTEAGQAKTAPAHRRELSIDFALACLGRLLLKRWEPGWSEWLREREVR